MASRCFHRPVADGAGRIASTVRHSAKHVSSPLKHRPDQVESGLAPTRKVPGATASTVRVDVFWNSITRWLLSSSSMQLKKFAHSVFAKQVSNTQSHCTFGAVWPLPLPFWHFDRKLEKERMSYRRAINLMVICLNWLHLDQPNRVPDDYFPRSALNPEQLAMLKRIERLTAEWAESPPVTAENMGRSAGKMEHLEATLAALTRAATSLASRGGSALHSTKSRPVKVPSAVASTLLADVCIAKEVESSRLQFRGRPSFDPSPMLDRETKEIYDHPLQMAMDPSDAVAEPPHVQVRGSRSEVLGLLHKLDKSGRLALFEPEDVRMPYRAGLFTLMKDLEKDRLILDSRPSNQLEPGLVTWTATMGTIAPLLELQIPEDEVVICSGEDLRDYYYFFVVTGERANRNSIKFELSLQEAQLFEAYSKVRPGSSRYIPALATMAMGDVNAVEVGQESHVKLAVRAGVCLSDMVMLRGRLPRKGPYVGIVIDDFIALECISRSHDPLTASASLANKMVDIYADVGLVAHDGKRFRNEVKAKFWGACLDGERGTLRGQLEKTLPLAMITSQVARLGWANRKLLEVLAGAWIAVLQCRRRCMCVLEGLFDEIQGYDYGVTFPLSPGSIDELWLLAILCPLFVTDLRARICTELALVDASNSWEAEVTTEIGPSLATELGRQRLTRAAWSRLLTPFQAVLKIHGSLAPDDEVPEGQEPATEHPLWSGVVKSSHFKLQWRKRIRNNPHINVSEMAAALRSESRRGRRFPNHRLLMGSDSQVVLGALVKGRSSSKVLNKLLKRSLPSVLAYNCYSYTQYIGTADNVADDPTRDRDCRSPVIAMPGWIASIEQEQYDDLDSILAARGIDDASVARLSMDKAWWNPTRAGDGPAPQRCSSLKSPLHVAGSTATSSLKSSTDLAASSRSTMSTSLSRPTDLARSTPGTTATSSTVLASSSMSTPLTSPTVLASATMTAGPTPSPSPMRLRSSMRTGNQGCRKPPVAAVASPEAWMPRRRLTAEALELLRQLPDNQFVLPRGHSAEKVRQFPGHLDLFSGCRIAAQELANRTGRWVLTYDILHSPTENLLDRNVQTQIETMLSAGCFLSMQAGPVCASFSRAVRPAVRTAEKPEGIDEMTETMTAKVAIGNAMAAWVAKLVRLVMTLQLPFWIENPAGSFLWLQPDWVQLAEEFALGAFLTDYCRWGTPWRKRTKFVGRFQGAGMKLLCWCGRPHVKLVGYSVAHKCCWTKAAEAYPRSLARYLAAAIAEELKPAKHQRFVDPGALAKCGRGRIGEAANPGPRRSQTNPEIDLEEVALVRPATLALQSRVHRMFLDWLQSQLSAETWESVCRSPQLQVIFLRSFGNWLYNNGQAMYIFRHLVVFSQQQFPAERHQIQPAWELLHRWESVQPVTHRTPMPKPILDAVLCLSLSWGWARWAAVTALSFFGACRVGEPLTALRQDLILPEEAGLSSPVCFLNISAPKASRKGRGRVQHTKITDPTAVGLAESILAPLKPEEPLYPSTLSSYRRRWDAVLAALEVPKSIRLTPGGLRGGGAIFLYHIGTPVANIQWTMRIKTQQTLEHYLQETAALAVIHKLPASSKDKIQSCARMLPFILRLFTTESSSSK